MKWIAPALVYLAVGWGLFQFRSAWGALLAFHFVIIVSLLIARPDVPMKTLLQGTKIKWSILSVLLCGSSGVALYVLWRFFRVTEDLPAQLESMGLISSMWPVFIAYFVLVNPFVEEYFWRGYLGSSTKGLHISDFGYAGFHALVLMGKVQIGPIMYCLLGLVLAGWLWRQIARENHGLLAPVLGHMAADLSILVTVYRLSI
jgi:membrane protease YdiL (CAAX protease family)